MRVAGLLQAAGVNAPRVEAQDLERGFLLLTDLGDKTYLGALDASSADRLFVDAIAALLKWQLASREGELPPYDEALLRRECNLFPEWYVARHLGMTLSPTQQASLSASIDLLTVAEHASSMLPWQLAARRAGASVRYVDVSDEGRVEPASLAGQLTARTRIVVCTHVSNVLGVINPARELCAIAREAGVTVLVDAAQSVPHFPVSVADLGCDFLAFSGHKMMGPMGSGVLWGRRALLDAMPPYQAGSNMAHDADLERADYAPGALRFGAGTPSVADAVGLAAAIRFLEGLDRDIVWRREKALVAHALDRLDAVPRLRILGSARPEDRIGVFSFVLEGKEPAAVLAELDRRGIAIRAGDLASLPLLRRVGVTRAARASLYLYTTEAEVDSLADALTEIAK